MSSPSNKKLDRSAFEAIFAACHALGWEVSIDRQIEDDEDIDGLVIGTLDFCARFDTELPEASKPVEDMH